MTKVRFETIICAYKRNSSWSFAPPSLFHLGCAGNWIQHSAIVLLKQKHNWAQLTANNSKGRAKLWYQRVATAGRGSSLFLSSLVKFIVYGGKPRSVPAPWPKPTARWIPRATWHRRASARARTRALTYTHTHTRARADRTCLARRSRQAVSVPLTFPVDTFDTTMLNDLMILFRVILYQSNAQSVFY